jgi:hypothetical protein
MFVNGYTWMELTDAINRVPTLYGRLNQMGLFPTRGIRSRTALVESSSSGLALVPAQAWGGEGYVRSKDKPGQMIPILIPQSVLPDHIDPADIQDRRQVGVDAITTQDVETNRIITACRRHFDQTLEFRKVKALQGKIYDADGTTVLLDLNSAFGLPQATVDFPFSVAGTKVRDVVGDVIRLIEDNLTGDTFAGVRILAGEQFFKAFSSHGSVASVFQNTALAAQRLGQDVRLGFEFGGAVLEEYRAKVRPSRPVPSTQMLNFIEPNEALAIPMGTGNTFATYCAPADFMETVNTAGLPFYAKAEPVRFNRGIDIHTQSNCMPIVKTPNAVIKLTMS